jgi:superfamily I DNA/RNA helicase
MSDRPAPELDLSHLNPPQRDAVLHGDGPLLVLAGAGSGKTRVITHRLAELVRRGVPPARLLAVTFTHKAAGEMRERAAQLLGGGAESPWIGTFHAIGARLLRRHAARAGLPRDFTVLSEEEQARIPGEVARERGLTEEEAASFPAFLDRAKNQGLPPDALRADEPRRAAAYARYQERLRERGAVDFGDLLLLPLVLAERHAVVREDLAGLFDHVLVDEFQDVNPAQDRLLRLLAGGTGRLMVVGDDDQAIYGWRGAEVRIILRFPQTWPGAAVVRLEENYRSTQLILDAANALIRRNRERHDKALFASRKGGAPVTVHLAADGDAEAAYVAETIRRHLAAGMVPSDFAVLFRVHAQARPLVEALRRAGVPHRLRVRAAVRLDERGEPALDEEQQHGAKDGIGVALLTVHAAKGLEFRVVFVCGLEEGLFPSLRQDNEEQDAAATRASVEEERRLFYVALTRARERLYLCHARRRDLYGSGAREREASRFLDEMPAACLLREAGVEGPAWLRRAAQPAGAVPSPAPGELAVGARVRHPSFGEGEVRALSGAGDQRKASVYFDQAGPKTLLARFLTVI